eukprot:6462153-Amphidinium_carterae.1
MSGRQRSKARRFDSELEEWSFYLKAANHFGELERDVASYAASHPKWISRAKLTWRKTKTGRRGARRVGSGRCLVQLDHLLRKRRHYTEVRSRREKR